MQYHYKLEKHSKCLHPKMNTNQDFTFSHFLDVILVGKIMELTKLLWYSLLLKCWRWNFIPKPFVWEEELNFKQGHTCWSHLTSPHWPCSVRPHWHWSVLTCVQRVPIKTAGKWRTEEHTEQLQILQMKLVEMNTEDFAAFCFLKDTEGLIWGSENLKKKKKR